MWSHANGDLKLSLAIVTPHDRHGQHPCGAGVDEGYVSGALRTDDSDPVHDEIVPVWVLEINSDELRRTMI